MGLMRSFVALAMARVISCARSTGTATTQQTTARRRRMYGAMIPPPLCVSSAGNWARAFTCSTSSSSSTVSSIDPLIRHRTVKVKSAAGRGVVTMAQPRKKLPERSVDVFCQKCRTKLYKYKKGGKGSLVKCYKERIVDDFTEGKLECPGCGQEFARDTMVHGKPAFKMIGGKVYQKK